MKLLATAVAMNAVQQCILAIFLLVVFFIGLYYTVKMAVHNAIVQAMDTLERKQKEAARRKKKRAIKETLSDRMWDCPKCNAENPMDEFVCRKCGYERK